MFLSAFLLFLSPTPFIYINFTQRGERERENERGEMSGKEKWRVKNKENISTEICIIHSYKLPIGEGVREETLLY